MLMSSVTIFSNPWNVAGVNAEQKANAAEPKNEAKHTPSKRKRKAFCKQLPDDLTAAGSESRTGSKLALPRRGSCQQQVGNVGAGNEENEADSAPQYEQWKARIADLRFLE
jgi:hypothetical protein